MYKIRYTPAFDADIDRIKEDVYSASRSERIANQYIRDFIQKIKKKQTFPQSGIPLYYNDFFTGFYFVHFKAYNAFYIVRVDSIELIRALSAKSDYMRTLFGEYYEEEAETEAGCSVVNEADE